MIALGIICLLLAAVLVVGVVVSGTSQEILFTSTVGDVSTRPVWVFVAGAVAMLLLLLGLSFFGRGTRRRVAQRREMRRLRKVEKRTVQDQQAMEAERGTAQEQAIAEDRTVERERAVEHDRTVAGAGAASGAGTAAAGYDEPDRRLVRDTRPVGSDTGTGHTDVVPGHPVGNDTDLTAADARVDENGRHRGV